MWVINLGCIDLNQCAARVTMTWIGRIYLHFDLDPGVDATFDQVCERRVSSCVEALEVLKMPSLVKTTGSKGLHIYVPIIRGPAAEGRVDVCQGACNGARVVRHRGAR